MNLQRLGREPVVLASGSATRRAMLENAGLWIEIDKPDVDEASLKEQFRKSGLTVEEAAGGLALAKAENVAGRHRDRIVLGADQMLDCGGTWFDKPIGRTGALRQLTALSGQTHRLVSAAVAVRNGTVLWRAASTAEMTMRLLSASFINTYLDVAGDKILSSVGGYQVEGVGVQLFETIHGDHFTILGMPLLPLLAFLRKQGALEA